MARTILKNRTESALIPVMHTRLWCVHKSQFGDHVEDWERQLADRISVEREIRRGETLYLQGSAEKNVYFLDRGVVKLNKVSSEGRVFTIDILKHGTLFGELSALEDTERDESAVVMEDGQICIMTRENFHALLGAAPEFALQLNRIIASRRSRLENKLIDLLYNSVEERLGKSLLGLLAEFGESDGGVEIIRLRLTHQDLSELIASTRETTTATLNNLRKDGLIDYREKFIRILNRDGLAALTGQSLTLPSQPGSD